MAICDCPEDRLCTACFGRELTAKRGQARAAGAVWAEQVAARHPEARRTVSWPVDLPAMVAARQRVCALAKDPRLVDELAKSCIGGAASWWERRPERYR